MTTDDWLEQRRNGESDYMRYEVVVGNVGTVYEGDDHEKAVRTFLAYVSLSINGEGRVSGESVTMFDGESVEREYEVT